MMNNNEIMYVFDKKNTTIGKDVIVVKDGCEIEEREDALVLHYADNFEQYITYSLPNKTRKPIRNMSLEDNYKILDKVHWGTLSFSIDDLPYSVGVNHIIVNNKIYFHSAKQGFKLKGMGKRACYFVVDDLGGGKTAPTHSYESVYMVGNLKEVTDFDTKKAALLEIVAHLAPHHPYNDAMVGNTFIFELELEYMIGKSHIY